MRIPVLPYADREDLFHSLHYRSSVFDKFTPCDVEAPAINIDLRFDDLRLTPTHEFRVGLNHDVLGPLYGKFRNDIQLMIFAQDAALRQRRKLFAAPIDDVPEVITLDRKLLASSSLRDRIPLEFCVLNVEVLSGNLALPRSRASRLAELRVNLRNAAAGFSFPHRRATEQEFIDARLPPKTGVHVQFECDPKELVKKSDSSLDTMLCAWIHEELWHALQTDRDANRAAMRDSMVTATIAQTILEASSAALKGGSGIEPDSTCYQLLSFIAKRCEVDEDVLVKKMEDSFGAAGLVPYVQSAFSYTTNAIRLEEEESP
jgi:hypothetical protein